MNIFWRIILAPFALLYALVVYLRNLLYDKKVLQSVEFDIPTICVGNLSVGGTGKTPHIEYLIQLLNEHFNVATMSRGYRRKTEGFVLANQNSTARDIGDEPAQFLLKYPNIKVCVSENRVLGVPELLTRVPNIDLILLDDAFQHRAIVPGMNILLTEYNDLYVDDYLLPMGTLRDLAAESTRADIIIVTKCPEDFSLKQKEAIISKLEPEEHQKVFFTSFDYEKPYQLFDNDNELEFDEEMEILVVSGIANPTPLLEHLQQKVSFVHAVSFNDHHWFSERDLYKIKTAFESLDPKNRILLTTEKDGTRLKLHQQFFDKYNMKIYCQPINVKFLYNEGTEFDKTVLSYLDYETPSPEVNYIITPQN